MTLAVLDWGIGGTPTWAAIRKRAPSLDLIYVSDSGYAPYGTVSAPLLAERLKRLGLALVERGVTHIAVACNAASIALGTLGSPPCVFFGIIDDGVEMALASGGETIAVLGGDGTIRAGVHEQRLRADGRRVIALAAQALSAHVEAGRLSGSAVEQDVERLLGSATEADAILLACTHYPALLPLMRRFTESPILDPCQAFASRVLAGYGRTTGRGARLALTTGDGASARSAAKRAFDVDLGLFEGLVLD